MQFSIVTPSFRSSNWLKLCIASVADQAEVEREHIIQDAGSDDGTLEWLPHDPSVRAYVEKDQGMYDAVNRGLRRAQGDILAYLNCDEQYLPGTLKAVADFFEAHPEVDIVFADSVITNAEGDYLCHRKVLLPLAWHSQVCTLAVLTCATFFRRRVIEKHGLFFDEKWRALGDVDWVLRALQRGCKMAVLRRFTSAFADTGENMSFKPNAFREQKLMRAAAPVWARSLAPVLKLHHRVRRLLCGIYFQKPFSYSIYTGQSPHQRVVRQVNRPTFIWKGRF
jgi:glycosyltransferase involved in cell wall biosynthesis